MSKGVGTRRVHGQPSIASKVRQRIERGGERFWRVQDFSDLSPSAVARALNRLAADGFIERPRRGLYYRPRPTRFGMTVPSATAIAARTAHAPLQPAGLTAANVLGLTTQNPATRELVTPANNPPEIPMRTKIKTRRPEARFRLSEREGALLELLRDRGRNSDLEFTQTRRRLFGLLQDDKTFARLTRAALDEPPRVRAMLGALGQELGADPHQLARLRKSLNPLSRFDFGHLRALRYAREWQAK
ncbi:MAG: DUF6088 family protein [Thermoleophilaceae bacterium]